MRYRAAAGKSSMSGERDNKQQQKIDNNVAGKKKKKLFHCQIQRTINDKNSRSTTQAIQSNQATNQKLQRACDF
jgi:hypothetical protein